MAKTTRRASRSSPPAEEFKVKAVSNVAPTPPRVKRVVEKDELDVLKLVAKRVELKLGSTYTVRGTTFYHDRPVVVTDQRILAAVEVNSRFLITDA